MLYMLYLKCNRISLWIHFTKRIIRKHLNWRYNFVSPHYCVDVHCLEPYFVRSNHIYPKNLKELLLCWYCPCRKTGNGSFIKRLNAFCSITVFCIVFIEFWRTVTVCFISLVLSCHLSILYWSLPELQSILHGPFVRAEGRYSSQNIQV